MQKVAAQDFGTTGESDPTSALSCALRRLGVTVVKPLGHQVQNYVYEVQYTPAVAAAIGWAQSPQNLSAGDATGTFVIRFSHCSHRTYNDLSGELEWMHYLSSNGISTIAPIPLPPSADGLTADTKAPTAAAPAAAAPAAASSASDAKAAPFDASRFIFQWFVPNTPEAPATTAAAAPTAADAKDAAAKAKPAAAAGDAKAAPVPVGSKLDPTLPRFFSVLCFTKAPGSAVKVRDAVQFNDKLVAKWGDMMGRMHALTKRFRFTALAVDPKTRAKTDKVITRNSFTDDMIRPLRINFDSVFPDHSAVRDRFDVLLKWIDSLPQTVDTHGVCHCDFHMGNFFGDQSAAAVSADKAFGYGRITLFDFDDIGGEYFANDIAIVVFYASWWQMAHPTDPKAFADQFLSVFLPAYSKHNALTDAELAQLPNWCKVREMILYLHLKRSGDAAYDPMLAPLRQDIESDTVFLSGSNQFLKWFYANRAKFDRN